MAADDKDAQEKNRGNGERPPRRPSLPPELRRVGAAYHGAVGDHGATPAGVGWSSSRAQVSRLRVLMRILVGDPATDISVADIGCGYGALWPYLAPIQAPRITRYTGFDIVPRMIRLGRALHGDDPRVRFQVSTGPEAPVDYGFISGTFNFRDQVPREAWRAQVAEALTDISRQCRRGLAFNLLHRRGGKSLNRMFYSVPEEWTPLARTLARGGTVTVVDDYLPDDFTLLIRFGDRD